MLAKRYACCTNPSGPNYWAHEINVRDRYDNECLKKCPGNNVIVMIITGPNLLAPLSVSVHITCIYCLLYEQYIQVMYCMCTKALKGQEPTTYLGPVNVKAR